jgi:hypothetical protein
MADIRLNSSVLPPAAADHGFVRVPKNDPYQLNNIAERSPDLIRQFTQELQKMLRCMVENINP